MTERVSTQSLASVSLQELRRYLLSNGFALKGPWGRYLERYHLRNGKRDHDVIVPTTNDISDYYERVNDALREISVALETVPYEIIRNISVGNYQIFRIRAHPGEDQDSILFNEGYSVLEKSRSLIKYSAVSALEEGHRKVVRGRVSNYVESYMEKIRIGQSDAGSYIFNLLLPIQNDLFSETGPENFHADSVLDTLNESLALALEASQLNRVPSNEKLQNAGISANFCEALYSIIDWSNTVQFEIPGRKEHSVTSKDCYRFDRTSLSILERTATKLAPEEQPVKKTLKGTVTRLSEPAQRRRGSLDLLTTIEGRRRSIRIPFEFADRETVIAAFKEKTTRCLSVAGFLQTARNGHLVMRDPEKFSVVKQGSLI